MKNLSLSQDVLYFALKYAVGRRTGAPNLVATDISRNITEIDDDYLDRMIRELGKSKIPQEFSSMWKSLREDLLHEQSLRERY